MGIAGIDTLSEAISLLDDVDPSALTEPELDELAIRLERECHRLEAVTAKVLAPWHDRGVWLSDGSRSAAARLSRDAGVCRRRPPSESCVVLGRWRPCR